jgi:uncharacterized ion transporter superfamily protein YfcC
MSSTFRFPSPLSVLMVIIILAAIATWLLPAGAYDKLEYSSEGKFILHQPEENFTLTASQTTLDSLQVHLKLEKFQQGDIRKPISVPGTYKKLKGSRQSILDILKAPLRGIYDTIDIILLILVIGGFIAVFYESGAMEKGVIYLSQKMKGKENWLIITMTFLFVLAGSTFGMAEEGLAFYPILVPLFLVAGYDLLIPVAVIFLGTQIGTLSSITNPFSTIIASNAAGINWTQGMTGRIIMLFVSSAITIIYIVRYANKIKKDPSKSLVRQIDGNIASPFPVIQQQSVLMEMDKKTMAILLLFLASFTLMVGGVIFLEWWLLEMTTVFLGASILLAFILRMNEKIFIEKFIKGAESLLSVAFIVGIARGVSIILNDGQISDSILFYSANMIDGLPKGLFIVMMLVLFMVFTLFIASSSGMAVLTMPIMGSLAIVAGIPGEEMVNAYLYGMGIMGIITPTGLLLPSLAMVNISLKTFIKFIIPLMVMLFIVCALFLVAGVIF